MEMKSYGYSRAEIVGRIVSIQTPLFLGTDSIILEVAVQKDGLKTEAFPVIVFGLKDKSRTAALVDAVGHWVKIGATVSMVSGTMELLSDVYSLTDYGRDPDSKTMKKVLKVEY